MGINYEIAWNEYGAADGEPVFYFHGTPGSRLEAYTADKAARNLGIRLIAPERPGYGHSTPQENFNLLDWPKALSQLADKLKLHEFSILGFSAGGPYALACAHQIPNRVKHITLVGSTAPFETNAMQKHINVDFKPLYELSASNYSAALQQVAQLSASPEALFNVLHAPLPTVDKALLNQTALHNHYLENLTLAINTGVDGIVNDLRCLAQSWQFSLEDIQPHIDIWHGYGDRNVGIAVAKYLVSKLNNTSTHFLENSGHYFLFEKWHDVLKRITAQGFIYRESTC